MKGMRIGLALVAVAVAVVLAVGLVAAQDITVPGGPVGGMASLYRDFGTYEAQVVSLAPFSAGTGAAAVASAAEVAADNGVRFRAEHNASGVADAGAVDVLIVTGIMTGTAVYADLSVLSSALVTVTLYDSPVLSVTDEIPQLGVPLYLYNLKRVDQSTSLPVTTVFHTPTLEDPGDAIVNGRMLPGGVPDTTRWILASETYYLLRVENASGDEAAINATVEWSEE